MFLVAKRDKRWLDKEFLPDKEFLTALLWAWKFDLDTILRIVCPVCGQHSLTSGGMRNYETLGEHVSDPNYEYDNPRPTLVCSNEKCYAHDSGFWDVIEFAWFSEKGHFLSGGLLRFGDQSYPGDILIPTRNFINRSQYRKGVYVGKDNCIYKWACWLSVKKAKLWRFNKHLREKYHINICPLWTRRDEKEHQELLKRWGIKDEKT